MAICGSRRAAGNPTPTLYRPLSCETGLNEKGNLAEKQPYPPLWGLLFNGVFSSQRFFSL